MRILYWTDFFWPGIGGAEVMSAALVPALQAYGHEVVVVTSRDDASLPASDRFHGVAVRRLPFRTALERRDLDQLSQVRHAVAEVMAEVRPQIIHLKGVGPSALFALQACARQPTPLLVRLIERFPPQHPTGPGTVVRGLLGSAAWVSTVCASLLREVHELVPETIGKSGVLYNGLSVPATVPRPLPFSPPRVLCLGRLVYRKGFDVALRAFARARLHAPSSRLVVAGEGPEREALARLAGDLGLTEAVDFIGWVAPDQVCETINAATVLLMPSRLEGLPLVLLQAGVMARPVIGTSVDGIPEVVVHEETGFIVPPDDDEAFAAALARVLGDPPFAERLGQAARTRIQATFTLDRCVAAYDRLYHVLAEPARGA